MATQRDVSTVQILFAISRGSGGMRISQEGRRWLHGRCVPWLTEAKPEVSVHPGDMGGAGGGFLAKFRDIGARAGLSAAGAEEMTLADLAARRVRDRRGIRLPLVPAAVAFRVILDIAPRDAFFVQVVFAVARGCGRGADRGGCGQLAARPLCPLAGRAQAGARRVAGGDLAEQRQCLPVTFPGDRPAGGGVSPADRPTLAIRESAWSVEHEAPCRLPPSRLRRAGRAVTTSERARRLCLRRDEPIHPPRGGTGAGGAF